MLELIFKPEGYFDREETHRFRFRGCDFGIRSYWGEDNSGVNWAFEDMIDEINGHRFYFHTLAYIDFSRGIYKVYDEAKK